MVAQRVLIVGGTSGIGRGMARAWRRRGATVVVCSRDASRVEAARLEGFNADTCDVTDAGDVARVLDLHGPFDVVVASVAVSAAPDALFGPGGAVIAAHAVHEELRTNVAGPIILAQTWLAGRRPTDDGTLVFVGSPTAWAPATSLLYASTKGGLHTFARGLAWQLRRSRTRVVEVMPPAVDTPLNPRQIKKADADEVGEQAVSGVVAGRRVVHVGPTWLLALLARLWPAAAMAVVERASRPSA